MKSTRATAAFIAAFTLFAPDHLHAEAALESRFRSEASKGWRALSEATLNRQGVLTIQADPIEGFDKALGGRTEDAFAFSSGEMMLHYTLTPRSSTQPRRNLIYIINHDYSFRIEKKGGEGPWVMGYMGRDGGMILGKIMVFSSQLFVSHMLDEQDLSSIVSQSGFHIDSLKPAPQSGRDAVELRFTTTSYLKKEYQIRGGRILFDAARHWCVLEYDLDLMLDQPCQSFGRVEYEDLDGFPAPKHFVYDFKGSSPDKKLFHRRKTCDYQYTRGKVDRSLFRLTSYGLPEPSKPASPGLPAWSGPFAIGAACLGIAAFLRRRAQTQSSGD